MVRNLLLFLFPRLIATLSFTECRNNVAPVYKPRAADVWSLGIVLINMYVLYVPFATFYFVLLVPGSSLISILVGFIIAIPGWTRSRMVAPLLINIF